MYQIFGTNVAILSIVLIWTVIWKGLGLWKSARKGDLIWFVAMLLINTAGILPIIYIYLISDRKRPVKKTVVKKKTAKKKSKK